MNEGNDRRHARARRQAPWRDSALCAETDPDAFFPEKGGSAAMARNICRCCEVRAECLAFALANPLLAEFGIWGGLTASERRVSRRAEAA